jgi:hypothetical protein
MNKNEWAVLLDAVVEAWGQINVQLEEFQKAMLKIFGFTEQVNTETFKTSHKYYRPPKNQHLKNKTYIFYKVEPRVQRHLPYQRRIF